MKIWSKNAECCRLCTALLGEKSHSVLRLTLHACVYQELAVLVGNNYNSGNLVTTCTKHMTAQKPLSICRRPMQLVDTITQASI